MISLVTPAFREAANLRALHARLVPVLEATGEPWEWIVVDDHSPDGTFEVIRALAAEDVRVRGLRLARREGSHLAIGAGLHHARGGAAIVLAADLQDPPEAIAALLAEWRAGAQLVWATRRVRPGAPAHAGFAALYYWVMRQVVGLRQLPVRGADFFLADRIVLDAFARFGERPVSIFALVAWMGFRQAVVEYDKQPRVAGQSGWTFTRKVALVVDSVMAFSALPLRLVAATGALVGLAGLAGCLSWAVGAAPSAGLVSAIALFAGLQMAALGVVGEYLWRALEAARARPAYFIEDVAGGPGGPDPLG